jgi:Fur family transcriptional regulator, ferric uptake regulator
VSELLDQAEQRLRQRGVRYTRARQLVLERLQRASGPLSVAELEEDLRGRVPTSSLYRTLNALEDAEIVEKHRDVGGLARYEIAEDLTGHHHHHLVCLGCGEAHDVDITPELERAITGFMARVAARFDYEVSDHRVDLHGWCSRCRS